MSTFTVTNKLTHTGTTTLVNRCNFTEEKLIFSPKVRTICSTAKCACKLLCGQGDSGGPLACKDQHDTWSVIGINSFDRGDGFCQQGVVARVSAYTNWIHQTVNWYS